jgi:hypothetical protein
MAAAPIFAATPRAWAGTVPATLDTSLTAPVNVTTVVPSATSGVMINQIRITILASITAATQVNLFLYDGSTNHLFEQIVVSNRTVSTTTSEPSNLFDRYYTNLVLQTGWTLRATVTTAAGQSNFKVIALGGEF